jgi:hypothetical protein
MATRFNAGCPAWRPGELDEGTDLGHLARLGFELGPRLGEAEPRAIERAIGALDPGDRPGREAAALQALAVDAVRRAGLARNRHVGRHVLEDHARDSGHGVRADLHVLVDAHESAEHRPVADVHVAAQGRVVREHRVAPDLAIVRHVAVRP